VLDIRRYRDSDEAALREICLRTGDNGQDATGKYKDTDLLSDIYAVPYTRFEPELCFVAEEPGSGQVLGYIVGASDSTAFTEWYLREWLPQVAHLHADPLATRDGQRDDEGWMAWRLRHPESDPELFAEYPAHLHINLVAQAQGMGGGRALMEHYLAAARARGAERVHLHVSLKNTNARAFYGRLAFTPVRMAGREVEPGLIGRSTGPDPDPLVAG
jgi:ribosomal protein S18 acetylase RimI-like enzyme